MRIEGSEPEYRSSKARIADRVGDARHRPSASEPGGKIDEAERVRRSDPADRRHPVAELASVRTGAALASIGTSSSRLETEAPGCRAAGSSTACSALAV